MKLGTRMVFVSLTALFVALAIGGCSKNTDAPKQEDQTQQELRKNKAGD